MLAIRLALVVPVLAVCAIAPGMLMVRNRRWNPLEKVCGAIGGSLIALYLASFAIYLAGAPGRTAWIVFAAAVISAWVVRQDIRRIATTRAVRQVLRAFAWLFVWTVSFLLIVRTYSGGAWGGDWLEHFHRTLFFADRLPLDTTFIGLYGLAARPPMMNLIAALFVPTFGESYEVFSLVFFVLNILVFIPSALIARRFARPRRGTVPALLLLFACSPMFVQNATYAWTKSLCSYFVIAGLAFYVAGLRKKDGGRIAVAFVFLAAGLLVHYSAGPYLVFIAVHYTVVAVRRGRWKELAVVAGSSMALVATWFAWSLAAFGVRGTLASNTSVTSAEKWTQSGHSNLERIVMNIVDTLVPHTIGGSHLSPSLGAAGRIRNYFFLLYEGNVIAAAGILGGIVCLILFVIACLRMRRDDAFFWIGFVVFSTVAGIAVVGERSASGSANVTLQPLVLLGIAFLAARLPDLPRLVRWLVVAGCIFDFAAGVFLQHSLENAENDRCTTSFRFAVVSVPSPNGAGLAVATNTDLGASAVSNWQQKRRGFIPRAISAAIERGESGAVDPRTVSMILDQLRRLDDEDRKFWGGWWGRHGQQIQFIGDHFPCALRFFQSWILLLFLFLLLRNVPRVMADERLTPLVR